MIHLVNVVLETIPDPETVTPGPAGFLAIFLVAVAVILLGFDMVRRVRRTTYRAEIQERLRNEMQARDNAAGDTPADTENNRPE